MSPRALVTSLRPHQWTKNLLVLAPLGLSKHLFEPQPLLRTLVAFVLFCLLSGVVYLVNDVADIERDRLHPRKRLRPIASGALSPRAAVVAALVLGVGSLTTAVALRPEFGVVAAAYLVLNLLYSFALKNVVIVDAISVSLGFVLRAVAGAVAIGAEFSDWLLICTILLALFLTLCKRRAEITSLNDTAAEHRRILSEYSPYLLDQMISVVTASCLTAYAVYTTAPDTVAKFKTTRLSMTIPFVLYGIFRYLYLVHRKAQGGSPSEILLTDRPLLVNLALWGVAILVIVYTAGGAPQPLH
jgi:4-hydroxybenzoate polyprenyltransferase